MQKTQLCSLKKKSRYITHSKDENNLASVARISATDLIPVKIMHAIWKPSANETLPI
ncbi:MAG: hypothetical protein ACK5FU_06715 [Bacteroidota bacterium]